jgi:small subunit ribosomal protein S6
MKEIFMPKYELMYILASTVSDDQVPGVTAGVLKFIEDFGGTNVEETQLGKKKLAYPIKKTRNGFYVVVQFDMEATKINAFEAKIRTQTGTIIRHIIIKLDEHLARMAKDAAVLASMPARKIPVEETATTAPKTEVPDIVLDEQIEAALNDNPAV